MSPFEQLTSSPEYPMQRRLYPWIGAFILLASCYALVFALTETLVLPRDIVLWSLCNALPHVGFAVPLVDRLAPLLAGRKAITAIAIAGLGVFVYAMAAYSAAIFLLAITDSVSTEGIFVRFFSGPALPWQMLQGTAYGCVALFAGLWLHARRQLELMQGVETTKPARPSRWLVKTPEGIVPVDPAEIIRIEAAGEYCRLVLPGHNFMSRIGMGECEARLAALPFLRAHRSHIVNSDAIVRAEPAGNGRLQLVLGNGDQIVTSRDGARLVRSRAN